MKQLFGLCIPAILLGASGQSSTHPFDPARLSAGIDSFVIVGKASSRPAGFVVQTIARDKNNIRFSVDYDLGASAQRVEMVMSDGLSPLAHWESLSRRGAGILRGEVQFRDGRARGSYILSKGVVDMPVDSGIVDDDAATALLAALPLENGGRFSFRTFASPGKVEVTRVEVHGVESVAVPAGRFDAHRLTVMARDTSTVFVTSAPPHRVVLVRLSDGSSEMRLINRRK